MSDTVEIHQDPVKSPKRKFAGWLPILGFIFLLVIGILAGIQSGYTQRKAAQATVVSQQVDEQFRLGMEALEKGQYEIARLHLDFVAKNAPGYQGLQEALNQIALWAIMSPTPIPSVTPVFTSTPDTRGADAIFLQAQQNISISDWINAIDSLDALRKNNPDYRTVDVDGMYYISLRERGWSKIFPEKCVDTNLEGGIYDLTLAERFGPLDNTAIGIRDSVRYYLMGAAYWEVNWENSQYYFSQSMLSYPNLMDSTCESAQERWRFATIERARQYIAAQDYCNAQIQLDLAFTLYSPDNEEIYPAATEVYYQCNGRPATHTPVPIIIPTEIPTTPVP